MEEQNKNQFAIALHGHSPSEPSSNLPPVAEGEAADRLDFDPVALRARRDGWTPERQRDFIEELADCGIVREAAARVGMTEQSATRLRRRAGAGAFSLAWDAALHMGGDRLRSIAYERAVNGVVKPRFYRGRIVGEERVYNDRLLLFLLGKHQPGVDHAAVDDAIPNWDRKMRALGDGAGIPDPEPDGTLEPSVWEADGGWWTDLPPPPGFNGLQSGAFGEPDYRRECTLDEIASARAGRASDSEAGAATAPVLPG